MNLPIEEFIKQNPPKRKLILGDHKNHIYQLIKGGYTNQQIHSYLKDYLGIEVSLSTVKKFTKKLKNEGVEDSKNTENSQKNNQVEKPEENQMSDLITNQLKRIKK